MARFVPTRILSLEPEWVRTQVKAFLEEDAPHGDITTIISVPGDALASAHIIAEEELVFAGSHLVDNFFARQVSVDLGQKDGDLITSGAVMGKISGLALQVQANSGR